mgnify:CR=1
MRDRVQKRDPLFFSAVKINGPHVGHTRFPGMEHHEFHPENAEQSARDLVKAAIENYERRGRTYIPIEPVPAMGVFSVEAIVGALGGTREPLIKAIKAGIKSGGMRGWPAATTSGQNGIIL